VAQIQQQAEQELDLMNTMSRFDKHRLLIVDKIG
jgi:hypothetical protein